MNDDEKLAIRQQLIQRFGPAQLAWSADGRNVQAVGALDAGLTIGSFAVVGTAEPVVVQIRASEVLEREGAQIEVDGAIVRPRVRYVSVEGVVVGRLTDGSFAATDHTAPFGEFPVAAADHDTTARVAAGLSSRDHSFLIGSLRGAPDVPARLVAKGFSRHTFMCGQSGSGKTYTTGGLFEHLLADTTLPLVVIDPNSDHVHLGHLRDDSDTSEEAARFRAAASGVRVARARGLDADHLLCADFGDLTLEAQALLLQLDPITDADQYTRLRSLTSRFGGSYGITDVVEAALASGDPLSERLAQRITNLGIDQWAVWRRGDESSIVTARLRDERCVILDTGSLPTAAERTTVALTLLGARWRNRHEKQPVLLAIDEAHNVLPAVTDDPLLRATTELGVLIAGEGRKFGLHLFVATQRPSKVHPNVVSQCDNLILMRMNGAADVHDLEGLFSHLPPGMLRESLAFGLGQALVGGPISPTPLLVQVGPRLSPEGGGDVPTTWATPPESP